MTLKYTAIKTKVCLGPGTGIQVTGKLFDQIIGPPISAANVCWDFFGDLGGGGGGGGNKAVDKLRPISCVHHPCLAPTTSHLHHHVPGAPPPCCGLMQPETGDLQCRVQEVSHKHSSARSVEYSTAQVKLNRSRHHSV